MDAPTYFIIAIVAHATKPPFRNRAGRTDGNPTIGLTAAVVYAGLSVVSLGATLLALGAIVF